MTNKIKIKSNKKKSGEIRTSKNALAKAAGVASGMDAAAVAYARLLKDPCNAALTRPVYAGTGSGYLTRIRYRFTLGANTAQVIQFTPGSLHTASGIMLAGSTGGASTVGFQNAFNGTYFGTLLPVVKSYRPVAACVKLIYTGAESARAGEVGLASTSENILPSVLPATVTPGLFMNVCPTPARLGMDVHEVRWAPTVVDQDFADVDEPADVKGGGMLLVVENTPASSLIVEYTVVVEWLPVGASGLVANIAPPPSRASMNDVLRALGPTAKWAYGMVRESVLASIPGASAGFRQMLPHLGAALAVM